MFIALIGTKKAARKVEKMFEGHYRLCRFKTWFLCRCILDDNGVTKFREVITNGGVECDFTLFD